MRVVSDDERREVARRLRAYLDTPAPWHLADVVSDVLGDKGDHDRIARLADLIEPSEPKVKCVAEVKIGGERLEQLVRDAVAEVTGVDRDALLALADEIEGSCDMPLIQRWARRIREALGVER